MPSTKDLVSHLRKTHEDSNVAVRPHHKMHSTFNAKKTLDGSIKLRH